RRAGLRPPVEGDGGRGRGDPDGGPPGGPAGRLRQLAARYVIVDGPVAVGEGELNGGLPGAADPAVRGPQHVADRAVAGIQLDAIFPLRDGVLGVLPVRVDVAQVSVVHRVARLPPGDLQEFLERRA